VAHRATIIAPDSLTQPRSAYCTFSAVWAKTTMCKPIGLSLPQAKHLRSDELGSTANASGHLLVDGQEYRVILCRSHEQ
jgi:hypothetical protein